MRGEPVDKREEGVYRVAAMAENPRPEATARALRTPGLRPDEYLCFFGMHVFAPVLFECLGHNIAHDTREKGEFS